SLLLALEVEHGEESLLRHLDHADLLHALLAGLLLLEQLALTCDVAAVALRKDVLAPRLHRLACDHARADRRLDRDVELLARDLLLEPFDQRAATVVRRVAVDDQRQGVDAFAADKHVDAHELHVQQAEEATAETEAECL